MARLVFIVIGSGVVHIRQLVEGELAIEGRLDGRRRVAVVVLLQLPHARVAGLIRIAIPQPAAARRHLEAGVNHAHNESVFEALVEVPHPP